MAGDGIATPVADDIEEVVENAPVAIAAALIGTPVIATGTIGDGDGTPLTVTAEGVAHGTHGGGLCNIRKSSSSEFPFVLLSFGFGVLFEILKGQPFAVYLAFCMQSMGLML